MTSSLVESRPNMEVVSHAGEMLAIILRAEFRDAGIHFFTPNEFTQQLAFMNHPQGKVIQPHLHNPVERTVAYTQEVLFVRKGKLRVDFYDEDRNYLESRVLKDLDVILLIKGGHGFEVLEELDMIEVKQGPYAGDRDKTRFPTPNIPFQVRK